VGFFSKKKKSEPNLASSGNTAQPLEEPSLMKGGGLSHDSSLDFDDTPSIPKGREGGTPKLPRALSKSGQEVPEFPLPPNLAGTAMDLSETQVETTIPEKPVPHEEDHFMDNSNMKPAPIKEPVVEKPVEEKKPVFAPLPDQEKELDEPPALMQEKEELEKEPMQELNEEIEEPKQPVLKHIPGKNFNFIRITDFVDFMNVSTSLSEETNISNDTLYRLKSLADEEDKLFERWQNSLEDFNDQLEDVEKLLYSKH